jgi:hypothetical protein
MSPGAATVIRAVMIRENLDHARGLDCGEARQDQQDKKNSAYFVPASDLRESTGDAHAWIHLDGNSAGPVSENKRFEDYEKPS